MQDKLMGRGSGCQGQKMSFSTWTFLHMCMLPFVLHAFSVPIPNLLKRINSKVPQSQRFLSSAEDGNSFKNSSSTPEFVYILLFNAESDEDGGVHTIEFPENSGNNIVLAFVDPKECLNFATLLKEQNFHQPKPQRVPLRNLKEYSSSLGVKVEIVPKGYNLSPPSKNVDSLSYNPNRKQENRLLDYLYHMSSQSLADGMMIDDSIQSWE